MAINIQLDTDIVEEAYHSLKKEMDQEGVAFSDVLLIMTIQKKNTDLEYALQNAFEVLGLGEIHKIKSEAFKDLLMYKGLL